MSVDLDPAELSFQRPFTLEEVTQVLSIHNPNQHPVAFKVKTTAPKQYCVRPNSGRIEPGHDVDVTIALQVMKRDPDPDAKCRDKFLVQSVPITSDKEFANVASILETADKKLVQEKKIRVNWLAPDGEGGPLSALLTPNRPSLANGDNTPDVSNKYQSPGTDGSDDLQASSAPPPQSPTEVKAKQGETTPDRLSPASAASTPALALASYEDLKRRLEQTEERLRQYVARDGSGPRHRGERAADKAGEVASRAAHQTREAVSGVPVQVAALLCLFSFLLAYFFF